MDGVMGLIKKKKEFIVTQEYTCTYSIFASTSEYKTLILLYYSMRSDCIYIVCAAIQRDHNNDVALGGN